MDSRIDEFSGDGWAHRVYRNPSVAEKNLLVVFLPGAGGKGATADCSPALAPKSRRNTSVIKDTE